MNIIVDYGNSSAKVGIFNQRALVDKHVFREENQLKDFLQNFSADHCIVSSVNTEAQTIASWTTAKNKFILHHTLPLPVKNLYATPQTLGVDRIAGVCGAQDFFQATNCLVIDAGTCITYDFLDNKGRYHGGGISPGLTMRFQAMHTFTARLPLVSVTENPLLIGNSTETCMQSGVIHGLIEEIDGVIRKYSEKFDGLKVILCGGDTGFFENKLKASIFASPELVLSGLNSILLYNVSR
ncbi:type III pantothenate kinase [Ohtaekwangia koreensis]|uniref:Type III pantothenate kinase n=1 Tax=Ohtaekwangia koreensis TaxID=688867 RepID=A0A1T5IIJ8_9BACT|nr:type III pantothenate kinase [Ohtaekwangia koreensis]SKC38823.1 type III pantothenate kinase [Ohtaekwangia koreensis]